jgi:hypothetical protein
MGGCLSRTAKCVALLAVFSVRPYAGFADTSLPVQSRVEAAVSNIMTLNRPGEDGLATVWDGNKYIQCRFTRDHVLRCESAGALLQPSLAHVLMPERVARLTTLGWRFDPSFGNYVQVIPSDWPASQIADKILQALAEVYQADPTKLEVRTDWIKAQPCPPRNGPTQNLAGMINDAPSMAATAIHDCAYVPKPDLGPSTPAGSTAELIDFYKARVSGEIARLRVNFERNIFTVFGAGIGYIQCRPNSSPPSIYCEAQSADSWDALASVLTPERVAHLHEVGFTDPGRGPNYWKNYPLDQIDDVGMARELLTILHDVYGYNGLPTLKIVTEKGRS